MAQLAGLAVSPVLLSSAERRSAAISEPRSTSEDTSVRVRRRDGTTRGCDDASSGSVSTSGSPRQRDGAVGVSDTLDAALSSSVSMSVSPRRRDGAVMMSQLEEGVIATLTAETATPASVAIADLMPSCVTWE